MKLIKNKKNSYDFSSIGWFWICGIIALAMLLIGQMAHPILGMFGGFIPFYFYLNRYSYIKSYEEIGSIEFYADMIVLNDTSHEYQFEIESIDKITWSISGFVNGNRGFSSISDGKNKLQLQIGELKKEYWFLIENEETFNHLLTIGLALRGSSLLEVFDIKTNTVIDLEDFTKYKNV